MRNGSDTVVVVGGGLIGCFAAFYLSKFGRSVVLIERDRLGSGASRGNCGYICPSHALPLSGPGVIRKTLPKLFQRDGALSIPPRWDPHLWRWLWQFRSQCTEPARLRAAEARVALLRSSRELYDQLFEEGVLNAEHQRRGLLTVYRTEAEFESFATTADMLLREFGVETTAFAGDEVTAFEPSLKPGLGGGWLYPNDSHVRPDRMIDSLRSMLIESGVEIREVEPLSGIRTEASGLRSVEIESGEIECESVVLATGAEAAKWSRTLGCRVPIQPGKGYSITMGRLPHQPRVPMIFEESHVAVTPFETGFRIGSTMEFAGYDRTLNPSRLDLLRRSARMHLIDSIPDDRSDEWCGWRPMSVDGLPLIGAVPAAANVYLASGNGMIGLATAPATGKLVAELVCGEPPHVSAKPYEATRFG